MASTYLSWTPSNTETSSNIKTISVWCKRANPSTQQVIGSVKISERQFLRFDSTGALRLESTTIGETYDIVTTALYRDVNAWYHIVLAYDSTQGTASNRVKMYVNGEQVTSFSTASYPASNISFDFGRNGYPIHIGRDVENADSYYDGEMTHFHFIDGTAYAASTFGESDANGVWKPKTSPSVTYGTNGFFLKFENSGSMGTDSSGNANNFTVNGSLTQTLDTPSNVYATFNPLDVPEVAEKPTMSYGNLQGASTALGHVSGISTLGPDTGKYYSEFKLTATDDATNTLCGVVKDAGFNLGSNALHDSTYFYGARGNGYKYTASSGTASWGSTWTTNDIIGLGLDCDNGRLYVSKNGLWSDGAGNYNQSTPNAYVTLPTGSLYFLCCGDAGNTTTATFQANFGNGYFGTTAVSSAGSNGNGSIFEYDCPSGYYALNLKNLATYG